MTDFPAACSQSMLPQPYAVQQVLKETADTFTLTLEQPNGVDANAVPARTIQHAVGIRGRRGSNLHQWRPR